MQKTHSHEIFVDRPMSETIGLFTPKGEESWVPDWKPVYIQLASGKTCEEMIFTTGTGDEVTFWTCLKWQPDDGHARYLRLTPQSRLAFVDVQCRTAGTNRTRVRVGYRIQALTASGRAYLETLSERKFADMIDEWAHLIQGLDR